MSNGFVVYQHDLLLLVVCCLYYCIKWAEEAEWTTSPAHHTTNHIPFPKPRLLLVPLLLWQGLQCWPPPSPRNPRHPWGLNLPLGYPPSSSNLLLVCCVVYFLVWRPTICGGENGRTKAHTKTGNEPHFPFFCVYPVDLFWVKLPSIPISLIMKFK